MKISSCAIIALAGASVASLAHAATHTGGPLTPFRNTTTRGGYTIDTVGDTLRQASLQNTRLIIRIFGPDKKIVKPAQIVLVGKAALRSIQSFVKIAKSVTKKTPGCR